MTRDSSKSGLGNFIGRGFFGLMSIALTATVSVIIQRSFDAMTRPGQPAALPSSNPPNEITNPDLSELDRPLDAEPIAPSEPTISPNPTVITAPSITLDAPFDSPEDANTFPETESIEPPEPEADSTSRVMREFWKKLQD